MKNRNYQSRAVAAFMFAILGFLLIIIEGCNPTEPTVPPPSVTTVTADEITDNSALIEGTVTGEEIVSRGVVYNDIGEPTTDDDVKTAGDGAGSFTAEIDGLSPETTYFYKVFATTSDGTTYGTEKTFQTLAGLPTVATNNVEVFSYDSVRVTATISGQDIDSKGIIIGGSPSVDINNGEIYEDASSTGEIDIKIGNLTDETTYFAVAYAESRSEVVYGEALEFRTLSIPLTAEINDTSDITTSSMTITATVSGKTIIGKGIVYAETENVDFENATVAESIEENNEFTIQLDNLTDGTDYFIRSYAISETDTSYSEEITVRTESIPLSVIIPSVSSIDGNSAQLASEALGSRIIDKGFVIGTTTNLDLETGTLLSSGTEGIGVFDALAENLEFFTDYNVLAYVYSDEDTAFSDLTSFKTLADLASVTTLEVSAISDNSAESGGEATGNNISQKGVVWSTSTAPTLDNDFTEDGAGAGEFTSTLTDLSSKTTYFVRAYVTNDGGTAYGNERSFITSGNWNVLSITPSNGATEVDATTNIEITFDEDINEATVTSENLKISSPSAPNGIVASVTQADGSGVLVIDPQNELTAGETYTVFLGTSLESENGNVLANNFTSSFTVFGDITAPSIETISPADGETNVSLSGFRANITFSEEIDDATINSTNFKIFRGSTELDITVEKSSDDPKIVQIRFNSKNFGNTEHEVRISTAVKDLAGNNLASAFTSSFTTGNSNFSLNNIVSSNDNTQKELNENFTVSGTFPLAESNITAGLITMKQGATNVPITLSIVDGDIVINPNNILTEFTTEYRIQVAAGIKDIYNNVSDNTRDVTFTTVRFSSLYWYSMQPSNTSGASFIRVGSPSDKSLELGDISGNRTGHWGFNREGGDRYFINHRLFPSDYLRDTNFDDSNINSMELTTYNVPNSRWFTQRRSETTVRRFSMQNQFNTTGGYLQFTRVGFDDILDAKVNGTPSTSSFWFKIERGPAR